MGPVRDDTREIQGYASATSVGHGEQIRFHVSVCAAPLFRVAVHRLGHYGGLGGRLMVMSPWLEGVVQAPPDRDPDSRLVACAWEPSWSLDVPADWLSGLYVAVFVSETGHRSCTPFVVREPERRSDVLVVLPFTTYAAYNAWPLDGETGTSLYQGYGEPGRLGGGAARADKVSFDRPYSHDGVPRLFEMDSSFVRWAEEAGYDVTYASGVDLHEGRVDPARHRALVFPGHDEYWSGEMVRAAGRAVAGRTHLAFLGANNVYWNARLEPSASGAPHRTVACYKDRPDPAPDGDGPTTLWRDVGPGRAKAEQGLLGVQYNGIVDAPRPLVVREAHHWLWAGTGLWNGDELPGLVGGEADGLDLTPGTPRPAGAEVTLLSASPYRYKNHGGKRDVTRVQNTALTRHPDGTLVFVAGTFHWPLALTVPKYRNEHVRTVTRNLLARMLA
ncbi:N,N-dimethylformamidase beta subunit family domain-containing protein [Streptomyces sp. NPDC001941]|uniref:N,N-dimethylformamidase beta subunit family domain-containing protein n=1 Tax=Streptomyces sp. NPDC001941 TaxID=3154659 RepID=UPI00331A05AC